MDAFIGMIMPFAGTFAPVGWTLCDGKLLNINQYTAVYALLGTAYGGDGRSTFGVPDLRGRTIVGVGARPGGANYNPGNQGGNETVALSTNQLPAHNHLINASGALGDASFPTNNVLAQSVDSQSGVSNAYTSPGNGTAVTLAQSAMSSVGAGQPVPTMTPYTAINYIMCLQGIFPSRP